MPVEFIGMFWPFKKSSNVSLKNVLAKSMADGTDEPTGIGNSLGVEERLTVPGIPCIQMFVEDDW